jgi:hypothetical protein
MRIVNPKKRKKMASKKAWTVSISKEMKQVVRCLSYDMGVDIKEIVDMAVREFASRRLPAGWEDLDYEDI